MARKKLDAASDVPLGVADTVYSPIVTSKGPNIANSEIRQNCIYSSGASFMELLIDGKTYYLKPVGPRGFDYSLSSDQRGDFSSYDIDDGLDKSRLNYADPSVPFDIYLDVNGRTDLFTRETIRAVNIDNRSLVIDPIGEQRLDEFMSRMDITNKVKGYVLFLFMAHALPSHREILLGMKDKRRNEFGLKGSSHLDGDDLLFQKFADLVRFYNHLKHRFEDNTVSNSPSDRLKLMIDPFSRVRAKSMSRDDIEFAVAECSDPGHFGQDGVFVNSYDNAGIVDGISSEFGVLPHVLFLLEAIVRADKFRDINWEGIQNASWDGRGYGLPYGEDCGIATMARYEIDRSSGRVKLETVGDAWAVHLDKDLRLVQVIGGESGMYDSFINDTPMQLENDRWSDLMRAQSNIVTKVLTTDGNSFLRGAKGNIYTRSSAEFREGDIVLVMSDWPEKIWKNRPEAWAKLGLKVKKDQFYDKTDILTPCIDDRNGTSGRPLMHPFQGGNLMTFLRYIRSEMEKNGGDGYELLRYLLAQNYVNSKDDASYVIRRVSLRKDA